MLEDVVFCDFKEEYLDEVAAIEKDNILEAWSYDNIRSLMGDEKAIARVGLYGGKVICYYSFYVIVGEGCINNLAVDKEYQHKGVGTKLMQDMIGVAKSANIGALTLEVEDGNDAAIALYEKFGFKEEGRRYGFYKNKKDALIMWLRDI